MIKQFGTAWPQIPEVFCCLLKVMLLEMVEFPGVLMIA